MIVVADASPVTALLHLKRLHLLTDLYNSIIIPKAVSEELVSLRSFGYDISFLQMHDKFQILSTADIKYQNQLLEMLDAGEAEAIALAKELKADWLLIDEKLGKKIAASENIPCKGVVGVLLEAKEKGFIPEIKPLLDILLTDLGFRLSPAIIKIALDKSGELP